MKLHRCFATPIESQTIDITQLLFRSDTEAEGWKVYWSAGIEGCFAEQTQAERTLVLFGMFGKDNRLAIGFRNDTLGFAKKDKSYTLKLRFDGRSSWDSGMTLFNLDSGPLMFGVYGGAAKFRAEIAKSGKLKIQLDNKSLAIITLKGSSAAFKAVDDCLKTKGGQADAPGVSSKVNSDELAEADKLTNEANALAVSGNYVLAEPIYRRALAMVEKTLGPEHPTTSLALNNLAFLYLSTGDFAAAEPLYRRALVIKEKVFGVEHLEVAQSLNDLAIVLYELGDFAGAEPLHRRAISIRDAVLGPMDKDVASSLNNLANVLLAKGDFDGAEPISRRALAIWEQLVGREHRNVAQTLTNLANILVAKNDFAAAEQLFRRTIEIQEKTLEKKNPDLIISLNNLANVLKKRVDIKGAELLYRRALSIGEKANGPENPSNVSILVNLAGLLQEKGDLVEAEQLGRRAITIGESKLGPTHPSVAQANSRIAIILHKKGDLAHSLDFARLAAKAGHPSRDIYLLALFETATAGTLALTSESFEAVQQTATSEAGSALQSLAVRGLAGDGALAKRVRNEQDLAGELVKLDSAILTEVSKEPAKRDKAKEDAIRSRTGVVSAELVGIREDLRRNFPNYAELSRPSALSLADAQQLLADDEALVVIDIAGKNQGADYVWALTRSTAEWKELDTRQGDIADSLVRFRLGLDLRESGRAPIDPALAHQLYGKLLGPVESIIANKSHLIFVLNGAVSSLPPQVLVTRPPTDTDLRSAHWLIRDHAITVLPTVSSLKLLRSAKSLAKAGKAFIGYGDPVFDPENEDEVRVAARGFSAFFRGSSTDIEALKAGLPRLPGTGKELRAVAESLGADPSLVILREAANEAAVKKARLADYNIVYFATHGLVAGEVDAIGKAGAEPALALTIPEKATDLNDGLLTASEVAGLKLNADWVVMSACNTAAEGKPGAGALSGLARAFFYAGARSLLVSHWVVDDDATAELMSRTFANAAAHPDRRQAEALRQAMLSLMDDPKNPHWADPGYWAAFVLVGEAR